MNAARFSEGMESDEYKDILHFLSGGNYFKKLQYIDSSKQEKFSVEQSNQHLSPVLRDLKGFTVEIEEIIKLCMNLPAMKDDTRKPVPKENIQTSICYLLGIIEDDIYPGIIHEL
jgi:hypothetical protein